MPYRNILFIDGDPEDAELFMEAVDTLKKGNVMRWQSNPQKALQEMRDSKSLPDLIFMDYNIPRLNGLEMLEQLKSDSRLQGIPVIMISGPSEAYMQKELDTDKIIKYFSKPNSFKELVSILDSIL